MAEPSSIDALEQLLRDHLRRCGEWGEDTVDDMPDALELVFKIRTELAEARTATPQPVVEASCGKQAASLCPRRGEYFACVLSPGHNGECAPGGTCYTHGPYIGLPGTTPHCPKCVDTRDRCVHGTWPKDACEHCSRLRRS